MSPKIFFETVREFRAVTWEIAKLPHDPDLLSKYFHIAKIIDDEIARVEAITEQNNNGNQITEQEAAASRTTEDGNPGASTQQV